MRNKKFLLILFFLFLTAACDNREVENYEVNLTDAKIKLYKLKTEQDPKNHSNYDNLAFYYFQKARETGNTGFYKKAEKAVSKSIEINPDNFTGVLYFAKTKLANHEFRKALQYAKKAVDLKPSSAPAYGILGDAYLELHNLKNAEVAYKTMLELNPSLDSYSRMSNLMAHKQKNAEALKFMDLAYKSGLEYSSTPKVNLAWTQVMIGSIYLDSGKYYEAESYFKKALDIYEGYYLADNKLKKVSKLM